MGELLLLWWTWKKCEVSLREWYRVGELLCFFFFSFNWVIWVSSRDHSVSLGYYMFTLLIHFFLSFPFLSFFLFLLTGDSLIIPPLGTCVNFEKEIVNILWFVILIICQLLVWKTLRMKDLVFNFTIQYSGP